MLLENNKEKESFEQTAHTAPCFCELLSELDVLRKQLNTLTSSIEVLQKVRGSLMNWQYQMCYNKR